MLSFGFSETSTAHKHTFSRTGNVKHYFTLLGQGRGDYKTRQSTNTCMYMGLGKICIYIHTYVHTYRNSANQKFPFGRTKRIFPPFPNLASLIFRKQFFTSRLAHDTKQTDEKKLESNQTEKHL